MRLNLAYSDLPVSREPTMAPNQSSLFEFTARIIVRTYFALAKMPT